MRVFLLIAGWLSLLLGFIGVFLPILPTTPFVILAALCFSKSSSRWHQWLHDNRLFGNALREWETHGAIGKRAKLTATGAIFITFSWTLIAAPLAWAVKALLVVTAACVLTFIWTRPSSTKVD